MHEQFLAAGVAVAGIDVGEAYGSPEGRRLFTEFYRELTEKRGFATRPCLLGRSRGGLWVTSWAVENPDKVAGIAGIYPVFDLRTYPGLDKARPAYGLTAWPTRSAGWPSSIPSSASACWRSIACRSSSSMATTTRSFRSRKTRPSSRRGTEPPVRATGHADRRQGTGAQLLGGLLPLPGAHRFRHRAHTRGGCASVAEHDAVRGKGPRVGRDRRPFATKPGSCGGIRVPCIGSPGGGRFL